MGDAASTNPPLVFSTCDITIKIDFSGFISRDTDSQLA
ncbi:hypothetical protein NBRC111893_853 [Lentilactobacillus kosonis]|uniref:Uncharacterized protein n=1 Tax=Lentilactobacillus kosonis TaxID=2810561 RepID=A0A401FK45_9LACO|nr:hypothetical protein NBRC111893_853 [Lentilactobacillus kosonis]